MAYIVQLHVPLDLREMTDAIYNKLVSIATRQRRRMQGVRLTLARQINSTWYRVPWIRARVEATSRAYGSKDPHILGL
jgi:hypothetical protein